MFWEKTQNSTDTLYQYGLLAYLLHYCRCKEINLKKMIFISFNGGSLQSSFIILFVYIYAKVYENKNCKI